MSVHLTPDQRATLTEIAARSHLTSRMVARIFEARTTRRLHESSVRKIRCQGGYKRDDRSGRLDDEEKGTLAWLISEAGEEVPYTEIARQFREVAGRPITAKTVRTFAVEKMGQRRVGQGRRSGYRTEKIDVRIAAMPTKERSVPRVDNSPRIVRVARVTHVTH